MFFANFLLVRESVIQISKFIHEHYRTKKNDFFFHDFLLERNKIQQKRHYENYKFADGFRLVFRRLFIRFPNNSYCVLDCFCLMINYNGKYQQIIEILPIFTTTLSLLHF